MTSQDSPTVLSLDIGGSKIVGSVYTTAGTCVASERHPLAGRLEAQTVVSVCVDLARSLPSAECRAVGVAIPGLTNDVRGEWTYSPFGGVTGFPISEVLADALGLPVVIGNDVNLCAVAEKHHGVCRSESDFLWMTVSNGVGGALYLGGSLYRGAGGHAGEIGHVVVEPSGRPADTQILGSLEAYASGRAIAAMYAERAGGPVTRTAAEVAEIARSGDARAREVFHTAGAAMGRAIAAAVNLLNLPLAVIGGGVAQSFDLLEAGIHSVLGEEILRQANPSPRVMPSAFPTTAAAIGAAVIATEYLKGAHHGA